MPSEMQRRRPTVTQTGFFFLARVYWSDLREWKNRYENLESTSKVPEVRKEEPIPEQSGVVIITWNWRTTSKTRQFGRNAPRVKVVKSTEFPSASWDGGDSEFGDTVACGSHQPQTVGSREMRTCGKPRQCARSRKRGTRDIRTQSERSGHQQLTGWSSICRPEQIRGP